MIREIWREMPVWMRWLVVLQQLAYLSVFVSLSYALYTLAQLDWSHGLEGVVTTIWTGRGR